jgi:hypothetical protein
LPVILKLFQYLKNFYYMQEIHINWRLFISDDEISQRIRILMHSEKV